MRAQGGAPVVEELNPTYGNLIGRIEHIAQMGTLVTDFLLIKPGALHAANGGYLLLDARKLLLSPFAWEALEVRHQGPRDPCRAAPGGDRVQHDLDAVARSRSDPARAASVVLFGDRELYYMLSAYDPDFAGLFKVQADFDDTIARSAENDNAYARVIASIVKEHGLKPFDASGVARIIDEGARLADDREKLSIEIGRIADIVREADYWSSQAKRKLTTKQDVARAIDEQIQRADRLRDRAQETIARGIVLVDTEGAPRRPDQRPLRAPARHLLLRPAEPHHRARARWAPGRVIDIEREVKLGGPLHSKGVMILWGFLAGRYALDVPLSLAATLVFEQSYGGVDGDSASSAELYALLSALSELPIRQSLAVTGSVNQLGRGAGHRRRQREDRGLLRRVPRQRGLNEQQGVLIPKSNVQHLMLREDVVEAVRHGQFAIYPISTIDEGIEILTGVKAGERGPEGRFPGGTINRLVEDKLRSFAERGAGLLQGPGRQRRRQQRGDAMIAHVARSGEDRGRVVLQLGSGQPERVSARGRRPRRPRLPVRDREPVRRGCAALRLRRLHLRARGLADRAASAGAMSPAGMTRDLRLAAQAARRQLEALARRAEVPLRSRVVRDEPLRALAIACAEIGALERGGAGRAVHRRQRQPLKQLLIEICRRHRAHPGGAEGAPRARPIVVAVEDSERLPALLRAAGRLATVDGADIVLLLIATDEERLARMDGEARLVVDAREDVRIAHAEVARGEAAVIAEALRRLRAASSSASSAA